mgnify:FL=1
MSYDIHIQLAPAGQYNNQTFFSFGFKRTIGVRGIQKLLNIFTKYLLTPVGSDPMDLQYGTDLPNLIGSNVNLVDAQDILTLAVNKAAVYIQTAQQARDIPSTERLASASVTKYIPVPSLPGFAAQVYVRNAASQGLNLILPTLEVR